MTPARRTQQERVAESTAKLFQAAAELIAERGYEGVTAAEIGRRAGFSRGMVRARFGSKEQLVDAVVRTFYEGPLMQALPAADTGLERVLARLDTTADLVEANPALLRMIFTVEFQAAGHGSQMSERVARWVVRLREDLEAAIADGQRDGSIRGDLDRGAAAHAIVAEGVGSAFLWTVGPDEDFLTRIAEWRTHTVRALVG